VIPERVVIEEVVVRIYDRGAEPEWWHTDRRLFGPWYRFEAALLSEDGPSERGASPWAALYRLIADHRTIAATEHAEVAR
jgi:myo-inositol catabolism protein IolC